VATLRAVLAFRERVRGGLFVVLAVLSALVIAIAVVLLARLPLLSVLAANERELSRSRKR
jgi:hypothetical protein